MAVETTPRLGIPRWPLGTDPYRREHRNLTADQLEALVAIDGQGAVGARPAPGIRGRYFAYTDEANLGIIGRDDGTTWRTVGGVVDGLISKPGVPGVPGLVVKLAGGATADALEVRSSADAVIARVDSAGNVYGRQLFTAGGTLGAALSVQNPNGTTNPTAILRNVAGQTASTLIVQNSAGTLLASVAASGRIAGPGLDFPNGDIIVREAFLGGAEWLGASLNLAPRSTGEKGAVIKGKAGQTGDLFGLYDSAGTQLGHFRADGTLALMYGQTRQTNSGFEAHAPATNLEAITLIGRAGQAATLLNARVISGPVLASITATGALTSSTDFAENRGFSVTRQQKSQGAQAHGSTTTHTFQGLPTTPQFGIGTVYSLTVFGRNVNTGSRYVGEFRIMISREAGSAGTTFIEARNLHNGVGTGGQAVNVTAGVTTDGNSLLIYIQNNTGGGLEAVLSLRPECG